MNKGISAKLLFTVGIFAFLGLFFLFTIGRGLLPNEAEYRKDQAWLATNMKTELPETPLPEVKYPIQGYRIPGIGGFCWLESAAGLMKYLESDVDFDTFVFYGRPTLYMANRNENERLGAGLNQVHAFTNLGYTAYHGATNPDWPPRSVYPDIDPRNFIYFKTVKEQLAFMKRLISSGIIPTIGYNGDFSTVTGYNQDGLWIVASAFAASKVDTDGKNFMTPPVPYDAEFITNEQFFNSRGMTNEFFWFEKTEPRKSEAEVYEENKKNAQEAAENLQKTINYVKNGGDLLHFTYALDIPATISLSRYLAKRGHSDLADSYFELAKTYEAVRNTLGPDAGNVDRDSEFVVNTLTKIKPLLEKIVQMWP